MPRSPDFQPWGHQTPASSSASSKRTGLVAEAPLLRAVMRTKR